MHCTEQAEGGTGKEREEREISKFDLCQKWMQIMPPNPPSPTLTFRTILAKKSGKGGEVEKGEKPNSAAKKYTLFWVFFRRSHITGTRLPRPAAAATTTPPPTATATREGGRGFVD